MVFNEGQGSGLSHYRQSLTLNKHTKSWLKERGWGKKTERGDWERGRGLNCANYREDCEEREITPSLVVARPSDPWIKMKRVLSDGTREVSSQFIWQHLGWVTGILNPPFIFGTVLSTKGPHRSAAPLNKISTADQSQTSRGEERMKGLKGGRGGEVLDLWAG